jgi:hypothetical protein
MKRFLLMAAALAVLFSGVGQAQAAIVYDAAADFSIASNPNGVWSYGSFVPSTITFAPYGSTVTGFIVSDWNAWNPAGGNNVPAVFKNTGSSTETGLTVVLQGGQLALHPGSDGTASVVRWTAPIAGTYSLSALFTGVDNGGTTTDVHILDNGVSIFDSVVNGYLNSTPPFNNTLTVGAGATIDFVVGFGSDGFYYNDSTALAATLSPISAVPEPATLTLLGIAVAGFACCNLRRRKPALV